MDILDIFFALLFFFPHIYADCPVAICGNTGFAIRFPFRNAEARNAQVQPENCGYPGFNLTCNNQGMPVLKLPHSGEFWVRNINYVAQQIQLYDPNNCLPRRFLNGLNLSGSPFVALTYQNYTFLSCPASFTRSRFTTIACLSNSTTSVLATPSPTIANSLSASICRIITTLAVPVTGEFSTEDGISNNLELDLGLGWYEPFCSGCEVQGGTCQFKSNTSHDLVCNLNQTSGRAKNGFQVFRIICVSIAVPAITCAVGIACFACIKDRVPSTNAQRSSNAVAAEPEPLESSIVAMGLDQTTIESYQMLVLGESRRLPGPNDTTCAICLSEYLTKETVRCIPECKHCFHADCVDEWLRMHSSCPVCRNNPSPAHVNSNSV